MRVSQNGINLVKRWEGCKLKAYRDVKGVWTIGWGTTDPRYAFEGNEITQAQADHLFMQDIIKFQREIGPLIRVGIAQGHWDALVSLAYNIGSGAFGKSTLLRKLNQGDYAGAQAQFSRWIYSGKKVYQGLINRRADEARVFQQGTEELMSRRVQLKETISAEESEQIEPTPASTNVEPDAVPDNGKKAKVAGGVAATAGALSQAAQVEQVRDAVAPLASFNEYLGTLFVGVSLLAIWYMLKKGD